MNEVILQLQLLGTSWVITPWKLFGYLGVATFAGRWFVQLFASHRAGQPRFPQLFWHMSLVGSLLLLGYFTFSDKRDSVGVLSNLFPCGIALYNLFLDVRHQRRVPVAESP
ncbi:MAG: lipid-A-disaccharide synthase N-terminal domain-containing protein [Verrucomicrobia bacterium]|nr:lipid-A-disaccharide synthase N-terminal domain-containing protein [Verrucomicrobiota bacterium]